MGCSSRHSNFGRIRHWDDPIEESQYLLAINHSATILRSMVIYSVQIWSRPVAETILSYRSGGGWTDIVRCELITVLTFWQNENSKISFARHELLLILLCPLSRLISFDLLRRVALHDHCYIDFVDDDILISNDTTLFFESIGIEKCDTVIKIVI